MINLRHTDREYEAELTELREQVLMMGARVEELMASAIKAFVDRDIDLAKKTLRSDRQVDALELDIDQRCLRILARRQPVASDLRFVTTTLKLVTDLERIGDLGVNICERVIELCAEPPLPAAATILRMADMARSMLHDALDAFVASDAAQAEAVMEQDRMVDTTYAQLFPELVQLMTKTPEAVYCATRLQSVGKYLERVADHATNIAEMVVFMVKGEDVRHALPQH